MKENAEKNLKTIETLANGNYAYKWEIDVNNIQEAYDFLDIWTITSIEYWDIWLQRNLTWAWQDAHDGWCDVKQVLYNTDQLYISFTCWVNEDGTTSVDMYAELDPTTIDE